MRFRSIQSRYLGDGAYAPQIVQRRNPYEIQVNTKSGNVGRISDGT